MPAQPVSISGAASLGHSTAKLALVEFSDFECPFCSRFTAEVLPTIKREYVDSGKVKLVFMHLPLQDLHPEATKLAFAAECSNQQGQFWGMHDLLFGRRNPRGSGNDIPAMAQHLPLDRLQFLRCVQSGAPQAIVQRHTELARRLAISGTPAFLVGRLLAGGQVQVTKRLSGARPMADFRRALEEGLANAR